MPVPGIWIDDGWKTSAPSSLPLATSEVMRSSCSVETTAPMSVTCRAASRRAAFPCAPSPGVELSAMPPGRAGASRRGRPRLVEPDRVDQTSTALSRSASSKTMKGDLPPSSSDSFCPSRRRGADDAADICRAGEAIFCTPSCATSAAPVSPSPVTMLTTPAGSPTSRQISAKASAVSGVARQASAPPCCRRAPARSSRRASAAESSTG